MPKINSRAKGSRGERQVAKLFKDWWGSEFTRTPLSGGFATQKFRDEWNASGDLVTSDPTFPFCVEVKWVEGWSLEQMLSNKGCLIFKWWAQTLRETPEGKYPLLVFKKNGQPFYCMLQCDTLKDHFGGMPTFPWFRTYVDFDSVVILTLKDLFSLGKTAWE